MRAGAGRLLSEHTEAYLVFAASVIGVGVAGATLSRREGRYSPT